MACDMCGKIGCSVDPLNEQYKSEKIQHVCADCARLINDHLWELRKVFSNTVKVTLRKWMEAYRKRKSK